MHYLVLHNKNATIFADTGSGAVVTSHTIPIAVPKLTKRMAEAIKGGAIREIENADEAEALIAKAEKKAADAKALTETPAKGGKGKGGKGKEETQEEKLTKMTPEQRLAYYKENFDTDEKDEKDFLAMKAEEQVKFLLDD